MVFALSRISLRRPVGDRILHNHSQTMSPTIDLQESIVVGWCIATLLFLNLAQNSHSSHAASRRSAASLAAKANASESSCTKPNALSSPNVSQFLCLLIISESRHHCVRTHCQGQTRRSRLRRWLERAKSKLLAAALFVMLITADPT